MQVVPAYTMAPKAEVGAQSGSPKACSAASAHWQSHPIKDQKEFCFITHNSGTPLCGSSDRLHAWGAQAIRVLRVLCREEFGIASAKTFVEDVQRSMEWLTSHYIYTPEQVNVRGPFASAWHDVRRALC